MTSSMGTGVASGAANASCVINAAVVKLPSRKRVEMCITNVPWLIRVLRCGGDVDQDGGGILKAVIHGVRLGFEVGRLGAEYARFESLGVAIDQRETSALHLHGNAMTFLEYVRRGMQVNRLFEHLIRNQCRGMFEPRSEEHTSELQSR